MAETAKIVIEAKDNTSAAMKKAGDSVKTLGDKVTKMSGKMKELGKSMTMKVTLPIVAMGGFMIKAASDLEETNSKIDVIFGDSAQAIKDWSEDSITSMGMASQTALDSVALYSDMGTGMGMATDAAGEMATSLTQLGGDLASFKNIRQEMAQTALKSIYTGETESLKNLGVVMTQANIEAFMLSEGIQGNIADMTQAEKVNIRYAFVMAATTSAQGDFERTQASAANQMRIFQETSKQLAAEFGEKLLPAFNWVIGVAISMLQWFGDLDDGTQKFILVIMGLAAALGPLALAISAVTVVATAFGTVLTFIAANPIVWIIAAIVAVGVALWKLYKDWDEISAFWMQVWEDIKVAMKPITDWIVGAVEGIIDAVKRAIDWLGTLLRKAIDTAKEIATLGFADTQTYNESRGGIIGKARGGIIPEYAAGGAFISKGTDVVPAMLTPGELVLNAAQQKNLAGSMGGNTFNFYGPVSSEEVAEEYADIITRKLQLSTKVV